MKTFLPPDFFFPIAWMADLTLPFLLKSLFNIDKVIIQEEDKKMLRTFQNERLLYFSNHPSNAEPGVSYHASTIMGSRFQFMAARQVFDWGNGLVGKFIQSIGAFSVLAGAADRESIKTARSILSKPKGKLVMYPEGGTSYENDNLLPFQPGVIQIGFWGMEDALKQDTNADIILLPSFVKYKINDTEKNILSDMNSTISNLEKTLGYHPGDRNLLRRFLSLGRRILEKYELDYNLKPASEIDTYYRIGRVRHAILDGIAETTKIFGYKKEWDAIEKLRFLLVNLEMITIGFPDPKLPKLEKQVLDLAKKNLEKAYDFIVIRPDYIIEYPSAERLYEWLNRFESLVYGQPVLRAKHAYVFYAKPFSIREHFQEYKNDKRGTVERLTKKIRNEMELLMKESMEITKPLLLPGDIQGAVL